MITKLKTNSPLDKILDGGIEAGAVTNVYGPAGCGKTNVCLLTLLECVRGGKKAIFIDTEGSFSLERFFQIGGTEEDLQKIMFLDIYKWSDQYNKVMDLEKVMNDDIGLIVIDSIVALYRIEMDNDNFQKINKHLSMQYSALSGIARKKNIPILLTNQVYGTETIEMTSRTIGRYWSKVLIELKRLDRENHRLAVLRKHRSQPEGRKIEIEITEEGMKEAGRLGGLF